MLFRDKMGIPCVVATECLRLVISRVIIRHVFQKLNTVLSIANHYVQVPTQQLIYVSETCFFSWQNPLFQFSFILGRRICTHLGFSRNKITFFFVAIRKNNVLQQGADSRFRFIVLARMDNKVHKNIISELNAVRSTCAFDIYLKVDQDLFDCCDILIHF